MYEEEMLSSIDIENAKGIYQYLIENGIYYAKDILIDDYPLFLMDKEEFIKRFEQLKRELGDHYIELIGEDSSLLEKMY